MKLLLLQALPLAPLAAAFVVPDQEVFSRISTQSRSKYDDLLDDAASAGHSAWDGLNKGLSDLKDTVKSKGECARNKAYATLDEALDFSHTVANTWSEEAYDAKAWFEGGIDHLYDDLDDRHDGPPHHGPPRDGPPHRGPPRDGPPHRGPPHRRPGHGHHKPNETVYQLIAGSKYTTKLAKLINKFPDLVEALNGTKDKYTVFAPTDRAFAKIPDDAPEPSEEQLRKLLSYHVSPDFYPARRVLVTHTIPTLLNGDELSEDKVPQRLAVKVNFRGLTLNFYARIVAIDIFGTNGVIHALDDIVLPPPRTLKIIDLLPTEFSTLSLGLAKTGLLDELVEEGPTKGGTLFAPSNFAFQKLGPRINAFLFSKYGQKYLKALLKYHIVPKTTLYSDAVYGYDKGGNDDGDENNDHKGGKHGHHGGVPKGLFHFDLPTLLDDKSLSVDVARYGGFIAIKVNGFARVVVEDGVARDGVVQVAGEVLIPPKQGFPPARVEGEMDLEEFKERLAPYVQ